MVKLGILSTDGKKRNFKYFWNESSMFSWPFLAKKVKEITDIIAMQLTQERLTREPGGPRCVYHDTKDFYIPNLDKQKDLPAQTQLKILSHSEIPDTDIRDQIKNGLIEQIEKEKHGCETSAALVSEKSSSSASLFKLLEREKGRYADLEGRYINLRDKFEIEIQKRHEQYNAVTISDFSDTQLTDELKKRGYYIPYFGRKMKCNPTPAKIVVHFQSK